MKELLLPASIVTVITLRSVVSNMLMKKKRKKKVWSRQWLIRRQEGKGILNMLNRELLPEDPASYRNFLRLKNSQFETLLGMIERDISKTDTLMREAIPARSKLETTLRFLATGDSFRSLMYATRIHESTISRFIPVVCEIIYRRLFKDYIKIPNTEEEWSKIAPDFNDLWQFPHCIGALDGRHIEFTPPRSDGSFYYNYKGYHSIVLLGLVNANYKFTYVNVGVNGRVSDGGVFHASELSKAIVNNTLNFPIAKPLVGRTTPVPYVIVADDAFPLSMRVMKPFPHRGLSHDSRIFNYRLSRARRIVENAFGILANRFRVLLNCIHLRAEKAEVITLACVALHNFLVIHNGSSYTDVDPDPEEMCQSQLKRIGTQGGNRSATSAQQVRNEFTAYFTSHEGAVAWQERAILCYNC